MGFRVRGLGFGVQRLSETFRVLGFWEGRGEGWGLGFKAKPEPAKPYPPPPPPPPPKKKKKKKSAYYIGDRIRGTLGDIEPLSKVPVFERARRGIRRVTFKGPPKP